MIIHKHKSLPELNFEKIIEKINFNILTIYPTFDNFGNIESIELCSFDNRDINQFFETYVIE